MSCLNEEHYRYDPEFFWLSKNMKWWKYHLILQKENNLWLSGSALKLKKKNRNGMIIKIPCIYVLW